MDKRDPRIRNGVQYQESAETTLCITVIIICALLLLAVFDELNAQVTFPQAIYVRPSYVKWAMGLLAAKALAGFGLYLWLAHRKAVKELEEVQYDLSLF